MTQRTRYKRSKTPKAEIRRFCARKFCAILEAIDQRCMAADGPVTPTLREATDTELRMLYRMAKKLTEIL